MTFPTRHTFIGINLGDDTNQFLLEYDSFTYRTDQYGKEDVSRNLKFNFFV